MTEFDNQGTLVKVPNYKAAFQEDTELGQVISKIGSLMIERGFPLKDAENELKSIEINTAEDNVTTSKKGSSISESPLDRLKNRSKADILIQIWWKINKSEQGKSVSFIIEALDSYTNKRIASSTGNGVPSNIEIVPVLLQQAVSTNINTFVEQIQKYFDNMVLNGREVSVSLKRWDNWDKTFDDEVNGEEITELIDKWMKDNTVKGQFNRSTVTENFIKFEQVMIPLFDQKGQSLDARQFAKGLQKFLKNAPFNFEAKLITKGLGEATIVVGEK